MTVSSPLLRHEPKHTRLEIGYVMPPTFMTSVTKTMFFFCIYLIDCLNCLLLLASWISIARISVFISEYTKTSPPTSCTVFLYSLYTTTCFGRISWPSSGNYKFGRSLQRMWQLVIDNRQTIARKKCSTTWNYARILFAISCTPHLHFFISFVRRLAFCRRYIACSVSCAECGVLNYRWLIN